MQAVNQFLTQQGLTLTSQQELQNNMIRALIEHKFWKDGFDRVIPGYRDAEFNDRLVRFIRDINLADLTTEEKQLIVSKQLQSTTLGRHCSKLIQNFVVKWNQLKAEQAV
jgi:hypothetical protein